MSDSNYGIYSLIFFIFCVIHISDCASNEIIKENDENIFKIKTLKNCHLIILILKHQESNRMNEKNEYKKKTPREMSNNVESCKAP